MVLPGIAGQWLDARLGTKFLVLVGFGLGIALAIWHLLIVTKATRRGVRRTESQQDGGGEET
jgi:hypothetical protein